ncbi:hypothetical protein PsorP6_005258 [Peronosclerospora sorghi]|uniref:Uncharacterized protein n=1 Tax=Peronosclerospora sorghi TaxID=230839 RepID=A0ACC0W2Y4_9STRA|nr:hypothetical protein PsorP6_005258 [Peronosclerospora sorghi]
MEQSQVTLPRGQLSRLEADLVIRDLEFTIEVTRQLESVKFDTLLDILTSAVTFSSNEDAQLVAVSGMVSLFSSAFDHLPPTRATCMYDFLSTTAESHRSRGVRHIALSCLLCMCEARATDGRLQWKEKHRFERRVFCLFTTCCTFKGIKLMLENLAIPEDVDVNEVLAKVVASIKYQAFGRAALTDEVGKMLREEMVKSTQLMEICQLVEMTRVSILHLSIPTR